MNSPAADRGRTPVAFVSGSRRGLGRAIAFALADGGFDVAVNGTATEADAAATMEGIRARGREALYLQADIADLGQHQALVDRIYERFGGVDCLVCNAGVQVDRRGDMLEATPQSFDRVLSVNLRGTFFLAQCFARRMLADGAMNDTKRSIIFISSANAHLASPNFAEYCMSKAGVAMLVRLLAMRLAQADIGVHEVRPGITRTELSEQNAATYDVLLAAGREVPMRRWGKASDLGKAVAALATGSIPFSTGTVLNIDGGMHIPRLIIDYSAKPAPQTLDQRP